MCRCTYILLSILLVGCSIQEDAPTAEETPFGDDMPGELGFPYSLEGPQQSDAPPPLPHIREDSLIAHIDYEACGDHDFSLGTEREQDTLYVWIVHRRSGDECADRASDEVRLPLPADWQQAASVQLRTPEESPPYMLR